MAALAACAVREQLIAEQLSRVAGDVPAQLGHAALVQICGEKPPRRLAENTEITAVSGANSTDLGTFGRFRLVNGKTTKNV